MSDRDLRELERRALLDPGFAARLARHNERAGIRPGPKLVCHPPIMPGVGAFAFFYQQRVTGASLVYRVWARKGRRTGLVAGVAAGPVATIAAMDHRLQTGQMVALFGLVAVPAINGAHAVTVTGVDTFTIPVAVTAVWHGIGSWSRQLDAADDLSCSCIELSITDGEVDYDIPLRLTSKMQPGDTLQFVQLATCSNDDGKMTFTAEDPMISHHRIGA